MSVIARQFLVLLVQGQTRLRRGGSSQRGDVPGWVLITLMTAGLVTVLWSVAGPQLSEILKEALGSVNGPSGE